jgi:rhomboid protease GluP
VIDRKSIRRTFLSRAPEAGAGWMAAYSIALFMLFFLFYHQDFWGLSSWVTATPEQVFGQHQVWRAFTTTLVHANLEHFLANSVFFCGLAFLLRGYFGLWVFPLLSFAMGGMINLIALKSYEPGVTLVGASGVVYFMAAFWLALYAGIERRLTSIRRVINGLAFTFVLLLPETFEPRVSYRTHAIGYVVGLGVGAIYFWLKRDSFRAAEVIIVPEPQIEFEFELECESWERLDSCNALDFFDSDNQMCQKAIS